MVYLIRRESPTSSTPIAEFYALEDAINYCKMATERNPEYMRKYFRYEVWEWGKDHGFPKKIYPCR